jgi:hypothetical protein
MNHELRKRPAFAVAVLGLLLAAGCGGGGHPTASSVTGSTAGLTPAECSDTEPGSGRPMDNRLDPRNEGEPCSPRPAPPGGSPTRPGSPGPGSRDPETLKSETIRVF